MEAIIRDTAYALRLLRRSPGFAAAVVLSLGLGIGANTAIFTLLDALLWRLLPIADPEHLLVVARQDRGVPFSGFTYADYTLLRETDSGANVEGYASAPMNGSVDGPPEPSLRGQLVSGGYFELLGVNAIVGRTIGREDDRVPNGHPVAVLSHGYWSRRFASDPSVVGRTIRLSAVPFTIIGVAPKDFFGVEIGTSPDVFVPLMMQPTVMPAFENLLENPIVMRSWIDAVARTKPGVTTAQAADVMHAALQGAQDARAASGKGPQGRVPQVVLAPTTAVSSLRQEFSQPLFILLAMVGVVLLTACANTANLLLARAAARRPELAMRLALGAGRGGVVRQLLVESTVLAALGGLCGFLIARWSTSLLMLYMSRGRTPIALDLTPNVRILAFTAAVSIATGILFGLAPAWRASRIDLTPALKNVRGSLTRGLGPGRILAIAQLALSLVLLVAAVLFARSLQKLYGEDEGAPRQSVVILRVEPRGSDQRNIPGTSERLDRTYRELIQRTGDISGVVSASMANATPTAPTSSAGAPVTLPSGERARVPMLMVYPNYFATIGIPFASGRDFSDADITESAPTVCIVNESFVRVVLPGQDPIGKPCYTGRRGRLQTHQNNPPPQSEAFTIVGVVKDSRYSNPNGDVRPLMYMPFLQTNTGRGQMVLHARASGNAGAIVQRIREAVVAVDPSMPMFDVHTLEEEMGAALVQHRLIALLSSLFGALALLLACVGLYGLLAFGLVQRTGELGIRMALGAQRGDVVWMVIREAWTLVAMGIAIGVPAAFIVARIAATKIEGLLFHLRATDPATLAVSAVALALVATAAAYLPARRASRVDPMAALRSE
jgi:predicted permease